MSRSAVFRAVLAIAGANLKRQARDRTALFFTVALPVALILLIGVSVAGADKIPLGVVAPDSSLATDFVASLETDDALEVEGFDDEGAARRALRRSDVLAALVVPSDYDVAVSEGRPVSVKLISDPRSQGIGPARAAVSAAVAEQGAVLEAARFATDGLGGEFSDHVRAASRIQETLPAVGVEEQTIDAQAAALPSRFDYTAPTTLVLFIFITSLAASGMLIETRRLGVSRRMLAGPVSVGTVLAGEAVARYLVAVGQGVLLFVVGSLVFGVDWGDPVAALTIIAVFSLVGTAAAMLLGAVFSTPQQAGSIGPFAGIALGMLGGCMYPLEIVPRVLQIVGHFTPHAWAVDAFFDLGKGASLGDVAGPILIIAAFAVGLLPLATWRLRRAITA